MKYATSEFKGNKTFQIWKDDADFNTGRPIVGFQYKKAKAIAESIEAIKEFVRREELKRADKE